MLKLLRKNKSILMIIVLLMSIMGLLAPTPVHAASDEKYTWIKTSDKTLTSIAYGGGLYVGISFQGTVNISSDLVTWTEVDVGNLSNRGFGIVKYLNGKFHAATNRTNDHINDANFIYSADGTNWSAGSLSPSNADFYTVSFSSIAYGNNKYLATSSNGRRIFESSAGIVWNESSSFTSGLYVYDIKYYNNRFIVSGRNSTDNIGVVIQSDITGTTWGPENEVAGTTHLNGLASNGSQVIAVGNGGKIVLIDDTSPELPTVEVTSPVTAHLNKVIHGDGGVYIAVGESNTIISTNDGLDWEIEPVLDAIVDVDFHDVIYEDDTFVAVGAGGVYKRTLIVVPDAPTNVLATAGNGEATVSFDAPASDGGSVITGYTVTSDPDGKTATGTTASPITVEGLTNGMPYTFTVVATNAAGDSVASAKSGSVTPVAPIAAPSAPRNVTAIAGNGEATVSFDAPASDGGSVITGYTVTSDPDGKTATGTTASPITVEGLTNGKAYTFTVVATNVAGDSVASAKSGSVTPVAPIAAPSAPRNVTAIAGNGEATVSFDAPASDGGSVITGYTVTSDPDGKTATGTTVSPITVEGLTNGKAYTFTVVATNVAGDSVASAKSGSVTPVAPSSGGSSSSNDGPINSLNGKLTLPVGSTGKVSLDQEIFITIPVNSASKPLEINIERILNTQSLFAHNEVPASSVYNIEKNFPEKLNKPATLTMLFESTKVNSSQTVAIFYYDEATKAWVKIKNDKIEGNRISVEVNNFMKFVVLVEDGVTGLPIKAPLIVKFSDITDHWAAFSINKAAQSGILNGYKDGTFKPNAVVTRAEFVVMLMNTLKSKKEGAELTFTDSDKIGTWAIDAIEQAVKAGIVTGYSDGSFRPNAEITRTEMAVMVAKALALKVGTITATDFADDADIPRWAKAHVAALKNLGLITGRGTNKFIPNDKATRAEAVTIVLKIMVQE